MSDNHLGWFLFKRLRRMRSLPYWKSERLKRQIKKRLATEDYTCRMVDPGPYKPKPRILYRIRLQTHKFQYQGFVFPEKVYK